MTDKIEIMYFDEKNIEEKIEQSEKKKNEGFFVTKEEQKRFWLTVFLPSAIAFMLFIGIVILTRKADSITLKWGIRIFFGIVCGIFLSFKMFKIFSFDSIMQMVFPSTDDPQIEFYKAVHDNEIVDVECDDTFFIREHQALRPLSLTVKTADGQQEKYTFNEGWSYALTNKTIPIVHVDSMTVFCPDLSYSEDES